MRNQKKMPWATQKRHGQPKNPMERLEKYFSLQINLKNINDQKKIIIKTHRNKSSLPKLQNIVKYKRQRKL